jgi:hypothetical protein
MSKKKMTVAEWERAYEDGDGGRAGTSIEGILVYTDTELLDMPDPPVVVRYNTDQGVPSFDLLDEAADHWYEVEVRRCNTAAKLVEWIGHLLEKRWVTKQHLEQFIDLVERHVPGVRARNC